jgi:hypothetical protein
MSGVKVGDHPGSALAAKVRLFEHRTGHLLLLKEVKNAFLLSCGGNAVPRETPRPPGQPRCECSPSRFLTVYKTSKLDDGDGEDEPASKTIAKLCHMYIEEWGNFING